MTIAAESPALSHSVPCRFDETLVRLRSALQKEGIDILCEVPFHREFQKSMGVTCRRYTVFVVWSQFEVWRAVLTEEGAGLLMPFNIAVIEDGDSTRIAVNIAIGARQARTTVGVSLMLHDAQVKLRRVLAQCNSANGSAGDEM